MKGAITAPETPRRNEYVLRQTCVRRLNIGIEKGEDALCRIAPLPCRTMLHRASNGSLAEQALQEALMRQALHHLEVNTRGCGLVELTAQIREFVDRQSIDTGLLTLFCRHTSASLLIQENADPSVRRDLERYFATIAPEDSQRYEHDAEGPDDMPAHLRTALTQVQLSIPIEHGQLVLGTWQGIYLFEHRQRAHTRDVVLHVIGA